ncbi:MAG TPA: pentapeptide repeat-containing protein [Vitreimonas sp.]|uniref:pentapeptide repeat-containing protein n=1 Tax=Vitreimonas sp. TaxID=3069702 RepID=UPI002D424BE4|nr:pentapeptide repeat-containing protein [Vitreimonas sp.]HYD86252.1 pentapeptide repeat-containing protein [Vitreimonas sp.]
MSEKPAESARPVGAKTTEYSEYVTGDQPLKYRRKRGGGRYPSWRQVERWRQRWTPDTVRAVLGLLAEGASAEHIAAAAGTASLEVRDVHGQEILVPDLRGFDVTIIPLAERQQWRSVPSDRRRLDISYWRFEGSRLTDLNLSDTQAVRAQFQKATLRRVDFSSANLNKAHLEDADLRESRLNGASLGFVRYTEDRFLSRGTVVMETHLDRASYVDPVFYRYARDQYYLYALRYTNRGNLAFRVFFFLWWLTSDYGRNLFLWVCWCLLVIACFSVALGAAYFAPPLPFSLGEGAQFSVGGVPPGKLSTVLYVSAMTFIGNSVADPLNQQAEMMLLSESLLGFVMFGLLLAILAEKVARRA